MLPGGMSEKFQAVVERYLRGQTSGPVAVMELLLEGSQAEAAIRALPTLRGDPAALASLSALLGEHSAGCSTIGQLLASGLDSPQAADSVDDGIARARRLFDYSVTHSEEASVALYSLGSPELLAHATAEAVAVLDDWGVLGAERDALEIGCGIGRFLCALSPRLRSLVGVDVSSNMLAAAQRRSGQCDNVTLALTSGRDLASFPAASFDLVYAIDVFPYLVRAGEALVEAHFRDVYRVLRPRGDFVIFNYAYGRSREHDASELRELGETTGYRLARLDQTPFRIWNGVGFHLQKPRMSAR
jgi:SAM-dependent methyltransferase